MKRLPIGIQTINKIIEDDYIYVDKTKVIFKLMKGEYFFLSRPRRFGKSLLVSTLKEIFSGNKELFKNHWIYDKIEWKSHPVIHIDFSSITHSEGRENFKENILLSLYNTATSYGIALETEDLKECLSEMVTKLHEKYGKVVILIDEYDKPIIDYLEDINKANENKELLAGFYETIKPLDKYLRFVFITGVSKFSKVSIFSRLNNLLDITMDEAYWNICGYTQNELEENFDKHIDVLMEKSNLTKENLLKKIKHWYNGYSWDGKNTVYNPFGILLLFQQNQFKNHWFQTATPTFLIKLINSKNEPIEDYEGFRVGEESFDSYDIENIDPVILLFQTGYLTIKRIRNRRYYLGYPNFEVKESFMVHLLANYSNIMPSRIKPIYFDMLDYLEEENIEKFKRSLVALFAKIPYQLHIDKESYYHSLTYVILELLGADIVLEESTDKGRIDGVLELEKQIYIIEFKMNKAEDALKQIEEKKYYEKYIDKNKKIILLGIGGFREKELEVLNRVKFG